MKRSSPHPRPRRQRVTPSQLAIQAGDAVLVRLDSGIRMATKAASDPFEWRHDFWVIRVEDVAGRVDLGRVERQK